MNPPVFFAFRKFSERPGLMDVCFPLTRVTRSFMADRNELVHQTCSCTPRAVAGGPVTHTELFRTGGLSGVNKVNTTIIQQPWPYQLASNPLGCLKLDCLGGNNES